MHRLASHNALSFYWSHAGAHFEMKAAGRWWSAMTEDMLGDVGIPEDVLEDFSGPWGDRRQEIVFIGVGLEQEKIVSLLDSCLLTEEEMEKYDGAFSADREREEKRQAAMKAAAGGAAAK